MIVFYIVNKEKYPDVFGFSDGEKPNKIGWVWTTTIDPINANNKIQPTLLELFQYLDANDIKYLSASNNPTMEFAKFKGTKTKSPLWFSTMPEKNGKAFFGFNYKVGNIGARFGFSFGTADKITSVNGIGLAYNNEKTDYSAGRAIDKDATVDINSVFKPEITNTNNQYDIGSSKILQPQFYSNTISFELYVR